MAKPRMSRSASAAPRSPATVEKRRKQSVFFPTSGEYLGLGVAGDVMGDGKGAVGAGTLGVHAALGDHLPVEVGEFLQEPDILQQHRAARSGGHDVLVVDDGCAVPGGQFLLFFHKNLLSI